MLIKHYARFEKQKVGQSQIQIFEIVSSQLLHFQEQVIFLHFCKNNRNIFMQIKKCKFRKFLCQIELAQISYTATNVF